MYADCFLAPITADEPLLTADALKVSRLEPSCALEVRPEFSRQPVVEEDAQLDQDLGKEVVGHPHGLQGTAAPGELSNREPSSARSPSRRLTRRRASDAALMDIPWPEYLRVVNAVAALTSTNQQSSAAAATTAGEQLEKTLKRWGVNPQVWLAPNGFLTRSHTLWNVTVGCVGFFDHEWHE